MDFYHLHVISLSARYCGRDFGIRMQNRTSRRFVCPLEFHFDNHVLKITEFGHINTGILGIKSLLVNCKFKLI
jgi:hypothetical protein